MRKLQDFLTGTRILEEVESPVNGKISVVKSLAFGTYISVGGLTQSGGIIKDIWEKTLKKVKSNKLQVTSCLILGLGGGTVAKLVRKLWPETKITGVDIDPVMVEMGRKYLGLNGTEIETEIEDAQEFLTKKLKNRKTKKYDLILIDLYVGDKFPEKFETEEFLTRTRTVLVRGGIAVFNRLYWGEKRAQAMRFLGSLEKVFKKVDVVYPEANVMFICL